MKAILHFTIILLLSTLFINTGFSQNWLSDMESGHVYSAKTNFDSHWENKTAGKGKGYKQFERWFHHWEPRVFPSGEMSAIQYETGLNEHKNIIAHQSQNKSSTSNWNSVGPYDPIYNGYMGIGRITVIEFHPTNSNVIFVGTPGGGLWKSIDGGSNWLPLTDFLTNLGISDIAIDQSNPNIMFVATGDRDARDTYGFGLLKSTDGGVTWSGTGLNMSVQNFNTINRVLIDPNNSNNIIASTRTGIYRSTNGGASFTQYFSGQSIISMEFNPGNSNIVYAGEYDANGNTASFYRSTDNGVTWTAVTSGLPLIESSRIQIAVSPNNNSTVYLLIADDNYGLKGVYKSTNNGVSFSLTANSPNILDSGDGSSSGGQGWYDLAIGVSPTNVNEVYVGGVNMWKSTNGGSSFSKLTNWYNDGSGSATIHGDQHWFEFNSGNLFVGNDGGVFKTTTGGSTFSEITNNIAISQVYKLSSGQNASTNFIIGMQDNGSRISNSGTYAYATGGDGMECLIDHSNSNVIFSSSQYGNINRSNNGGTSFSDVSPNGGNGPWITPFVMDPNNSNILYLGDDDIYKSTNNGVNWNQISTGFSDQIRFMDVSKANSNLIYAATYSNLYKSINAGLSWVDITGTLPAGFASISSVKSNPTNSNQLWVTFSSYSAGNKVFRSDNQGSSWVNMSGSLPNLPVNDIVFEEGSIGLLYIGTDVGVYYYDPATSLWAVYGVNLPNVIVTDLSIQYAQNILRVGTYGRGIWEISLNSILPPVADFTAAPTNICVGGVVSYLNNSTLADSYAWVFEGGTPTTSTDVNPVVTYSTPGSYYAKLIATNSIGDNEIIQSNLITVVASDINLTSIGNATNVYTNLRNNTQPIVVNNDLNTVAFIHRQNTGEFIGTSGSFRYDYSTDNGQSWTVNSQILNSSATVGINDGRYPQISIFNPALNSDPTQASIVFNGSTVGNGWGDYVTGSGLIGGASYSENYNQTATTDNLILSSLSKGGTDTYWSVDLSYDGTNYSGFKILKGIWNGTDVTWSLNSTILPNFNTAYSGNPVIGDYKIAFDESGQNGWVVLLSHLASGPGANQYYPIFYKTTNGGITWSGPIEIDLATFPSITNNIVGYPTQVPTTTFDASITVDLNGNPHCVFIVGGGDGLNYSIATNDWMGACHLYNDGVNWNATILDEVNTFRNTLVGGATHDNTPQISRSDNGGLIVMAWTDSDPLVTGVDNSLPSMKISTYNVSSNIYSSVETVDECPIDPGRMVFLKIADNLIETNTGFYVAGVVSDINNSGSGDDMTGHKFFTYLIPNTCVAQASVNAPSSVCVNSSITLTDNSTNTSGYSYAWDVNNNGVTDYISSGNLNHTYTSAGSKTVSLTLTDISGCITSVSTTIIVHELPNLDVVYDSDICGLTQIDYVNNSLINEPGTYSWDFNGDMINESNSSTDQIYIPLNYGTLNGIVNVTDFNGCVGSVPLNVVVSESPIVDFDLSSEACVNSDVIFTDGSVNGMIYSWDVDGDNNEDYNTAGNVSHTYATIGNKDVTLTLINGSCVVSETNSILILDTPNSNFSVDLASGTTYNFTDLSTNNAGTVYDWNFGDGTTSSIVGNTSHTYSNYNPYTTVLTLTNICGTNESIQEVEGSIGVDENEILLFAVYPNPANTNLIVNFSDDLPATITIYNGIGEVVYFNKDRTTSVSCDVSTFAEGMYYIRVSNAYYSSTQKVMIKH
jgi:PKD repeat protein/photosystem II stability/assembly factor-like uncharacterized protein